VRAGRTRAAPLAPSKRCGSRKTPARNSAAGGAAGADGMNRAQRGCRRRYAAWSALVAQRIEHLTTDKCSIDGVLTCELSDHRFTVCAESKADDPTWTRLYNDVSIMIGDGRLEPNMLVSPAGEAASLWSMPAIAAQRAFRALERDGWLARCPDCGQWVVRP
jgi:hypothetical protein